MGDRLTAFRVKLGMRDPNDPTPEPMNGIDELAWLREIFAQSPSSRRCSAILTAYSLDLRERVVATVGGGVDASFLSSKRWPTGSDRLAHPGRRHRQCHCWCSGNVAKGGRRVRAAWHTPVGGTGNVTVGVQATWRTVWHLEVRATDFIGSVTVQPLADRSFFAFNARRTFEALNN
jgi:Protein of unknown function (DUF1302)